MNYIENIKKALFVDEKINYFRFKASILVFVLLNFLFFINYYFLGARFYYDYAIIFFPYLYILLLLSFGFLVFFALKYKFPKIKNYLYMLILLFLIIILLIFSIFIVFGKDIL